MISPVTKNRTKQAATSSSSVADVTINQSRVMQGFFVFPALGVSNEPRYQSQFFTASMHFYSMDVVFLMLFRLSIPGIVFF